MKKRFLYIALITLTLGACTEQDIVEQPSIPTDGGTEVRLPTDVNSGELLIKFKPEMTDILDRTMTRAAGNGGGCQYSGGSIQPKGMGFCRKAHSPPLEHPDGGRRLGGPQKE